MVDAVIDTGNSAKRVLGFVRFLRSEDYSVGVAEAQSIARSLVIAADPDPTTSQTLMRSLCCRNRDEWYRFNKLFQQYWFPGEVGDPPVADPIRQALTSGGGMVGMGTGIDNPAAYDSEVSAGSGAAKQTTITKADFRFLGDKRAMRRAERFAEQLARRLTDRTSRRKKITTRSGQLALPQTLRKSVRFGGLPLIPLYKRPRRVPPNIVVLHDVSHSMTFNNPLLVRFVRGLVRRFRSVEAFVFHTRLFRVTPMYRESSLQRMREQLEATNHLWLGGTCIADSIDEFLNNHARSVLTMKTRVIIISDGCDANAPEQLAEKLSAIRRCCREVVWLNPMLERAGVDPYSPPIQNVRNHVDRLLPAHSLAALRQLVDHLSK